MPFKLAQRLGLQWKGIMIQSHIEMMNSHNPFYVDL